MAEQSRTGLTTPLETKPRGANRSTKVAGKLKVLPEQPEDLPILGERKPRAEDISTGTTGDSDEGDVEENEESDEPEVEVNNMFCR